MGPRTKQKLQDEKLKSKLNWIITEHKKNIKEIDYVYSDIAEETKRAEIAKRQKRLEELQEQYLLKKQQAAMQGNVNNS